MNKKLFLLLSTVCAVIFSACGNKPVTEETSSPVKEKTIVVTEIITTESEPYYAEDMEKVPENAAYRCTENVTAKDGTVRRNYVFYDTHNNEIKRINQTTKESYEKSVWDYTYEYNDDGTVHSDYLKDGNFNIYEYNSDGTLSKESSYKNMDDENTDYIVNYTYNGGKNPVREDYTISDGDDFSYDYEYKYDNNGRMIWKKSESSNFYTEETFTYDENNNVIAHRTDYGKILEEEKYTYNEKNRPLTKEIFKDDISISFSEYEYQDYN